ncbi:MAG: hypothetical protein RLZZ399_2019 [Verrucomicrobiota bacterium]|jgi:hypothetical protein
MARRMDRVVRITAIRAVITDEIHRKTGNAQDCAEVDGPSKSSLQVIGMGTHGESQRGIPPSFGFALSPSHYFAGQS